MIQYNIPIERKKTELETEPCIIEAVVELNSERFSQFSHNLMDDYPFLNEHGKLMYGDADGVHCLLVLGEGRDDGIVVDSEGYAYARYAGVLPGARALIEMHVQKIADRLIAEGMQKTETGDWTIPFEQIAQSERLAIDRSRYLQIRLADCLLRSEQTRTVFADREGVFISFDPAFCTNLNQEQEGIHELRM